MPATKNKITSLSTFHKGQDYKALRAMLEFERPEILVEFDDQKNEIRFVFGKQSVAYIR